MKKPLSVGDPIPYFQVKDQEGFTFTNEDLLGKPIVFYFYPKDLTPGCTKQACELRDQIPQIEHLGAVVIGISPDTAASHQKFIQKHHLNFTLLADETTKMCQAFGVIHDGKLQRSTFIADANGIIRWVERGVNIQGHSERVLKAIEITKQAYREEEEKFFSDRAKKKQFPSS